VTPVDISSPLLPVTSAVVLLALLEPRSLRATTRG